jgi:predicted metal-dependent hydrolase
LRTLRELPSHAFWIGRRLYPVRVRESARARYARVTVAPGRPLDVVVPTGSASHDVDALLEEKRGWLERKLAEAQMRARPRLGLDRPGVVWLSGRPIPTRNVLHVASDAAGVDAWYRRVARNRIGAALKREAAEMRVEYARVTIRDARTLWGSCSARRNLSFSWRLVLAPTCVLDYVVVHELCHLRELNHSQRFWNLLDSVRPNWQSDDEWLREHGDELLGYWPGRALLHAAEPKQLTLWAA